MAKPFVPRKNLDDDDEITEESVQIVPVMVESDDDFDDITEEIEVNTPPMAEDISHVADLARIRMQAWDRSRHEETGPPDPMVLSIVNEPIHGQGDEINGPSLWEIMADYTLSNPESLSELLQVLQRMYQTLVKEYDLTEERWDEIKNYMAMKVLEAVNNNRFGPNNMGMVKAVDWREAGEEVQNRIDAFLESDDCANAVAADVGIYGGNHYFKETLEALGITDTRQIMDAAYSEAIKKWRSEGGLGRKFARLRTARQAVANEEGGE